MAINRELDANLANKMKLLFLEVIIAPSITAEALTVLSDKPNLRVLSSGTIPNAKDNGLQIKSISGGMLVQSRDNHVLKKEDLNFVTKKIPGTLMK